MQAPAPTGCHEKHLSSCPQSPPPPLFSSIKPSTGDGNSTQRLKIQPSRSRSGHVMAQGLCSVMWSLALARSCLRYSFQCFTCLSPSAALFHGKSEGIDYSPWASRKILVSVCLPALQSGPWIPPEGSRICQKAERSQLVEFGRSWYL